MYHKKITSFACGFLLKKTPGTGNSVPGVKVLLVQEIGIYAVFVEIIIAIIKRTIVDKLNSTAC